MGFKQRYDAACAELESVCQDCGRNPKDVRIIAVSKTVGVDVVGEAIRAEAHSFGENRPDMILEKHAAYPTEDWHFIGNIQSRRIADIVSCASMIHSLYQESHARKIDAAAQAAGKVQDVLLEVNVSGELSKSGLEPDQVADLLETCLQLPHVRVRGLMTMAPQGDLEVARSCFKGLARLQEDLRSTLPAEAAQYFTELSMGMSEDWREAVAEGATMVRIGRALFSDSF